MLDFAYYILDFILILFKEAWYVKLVFFVSFITRPLIPFREESVEERTVSVLPVNSLYFKSCKLFNFHYSLIDSIQLEFERRLFLQDGFYPDFL